MFELILELVLDDADIENNFRQASEIGKSKNIRLLFSTPPSQGKSKYQMTNLDPLPPAHLRL